MLRAPECATIKEITVATGWQAHTVRCAIAGRTLRKGEKCDWLYKRIEAAKEEDKIVEACCECAGDYDDDY